MSAIEPPDPDIPRMQRRTRIALTKALAPLGGFPTDATPRADLAALIERLHPVLGGHDLIRLGPDGDGGYLVPDALDGIEACFSPGVNTVSGFELDCAERGMRVFLADRSVDAPAEQHELFEFTRKFVGATSDETYMTLDEWVAGSLPIRDSELLLQMDVEGSEYEVLLSSSAGLMRRFRVIVIEFHDLDQLWSRPFFSVASRAIERLLQTHTCVHIHPNNWRTPVVRDGITILPAMEFTFLRTADVTDRTYRTQFPHPLDRHNGAPREYDLPRSWYRAV